VADACTIISRQPLTLCSGPAQLFLLLKRTAVQAAFGSCQSENQPTKCSTLRSNDTEGRLFSCRVPCTEWLLLQFCRNCRWIPKPVLVDDLDRMLKWDDFGTRDRVEEAVTDAQTTTRRSRETFPLWVEAARENLEALFWGYLFCKSEPLGL
jgi:hypothetical protein